MKILFVCQRLPGISWFILLELQCRDQNVLSAHCCSETLWFNCGATYNSGGTDTVSKTHIYLYNWILFFCLFALADYTLFFHSTVHTREQEIIYLGTEYFDTCNIRCRLWIYGSFLWLFPKVWLNCSIFLPHLFCCSNSQDGLIRADFTDSKLMQGLFSLSFNSFQIGKSELFTQESATVLSESDWLCGFF